MRGSLLLLVLLCPVVQGQFSAFSWTLEGNAYGSGQIVGETMTVTGPDTQASCTVHSTWFETVTPVALHVDVDVDYETLDDWPSYKYFDAPAWVIDGWTSTPASTTGWDTGFYHLAFDVPAGSTFGLGVWSMDCCCGPGIARFENLVVEVIPLVELHGGIDPKSSWIVVESGTSLGTAVAAVDDLDGDGVPDVAVGRPDATDGRVQVLSGTDGATLLDVSGGAGFGAVVVGPGDMNADGVPDLLVGAPKNAGTLTSPGKALLVSGADGSTLVTINGDSSSALLGAALAAAEDFDGDGTRDVVAGAIGHLGFGKPPLVRVVSGTTGATILQIDDPGTGKQFARAVLSPGDLDGDGGPDVVVGAPPFSDAYSAVAGLVLAFSGSDGELLYTVSGPGAFGYSLAAVGDVDGDGTSDILVGAPGVHVGAVNHGAISLLSGATGAVLLAFTGPLAGLGAGRSVASGDVDGDGLLDLIVAAPAVSALQAGVTFVVSAQDGTLLNTVGVGVPGAYGSLVAQVGDVDLDGRDDLVTGGKGVVHAWHGLHKTGAPTLTIDTTLQPDSPFVVTVEGAEPDTTGLLLIGFTKLDLPALGGVLVPSLNLLVPFATAVAGGSTLEGRWPAAAPSFWSLWMQAWIVDPQGPQGFTATNGWSVSTD